MPNQVFLNTPDNEEIDPTWILSLKAPLITICSLLSRSGNELKRGFQNFSLKSSTPTNSFNG